MLDELVPPPLTVRSDFNGIVVSPGTILLPDLKPYAAYGPGIFYQNCDVWRRAVKIPTKGRHTGGRVVLRTDLRKQTIKLHILRSSDGRRTPPPARKKRFRDFTIALFEIDITGCITVYQPQIDANIPTPARSQSSLRLLS